MQVFLLLLILILFNLVSGDCCNRVRAWYVTDRKNRSFDLQDSRFGYYSIKPGTINGKPHYVSDDGEQAIWYDGNSWNVGLTDDQGTTRAGIHVNSKANCPEEPIFDWEYLNNSNDWVPAEQGFSIYCKD